VVFVHANLLKEMPRSEFHVDHEKGVFRVFKDYTLVEGNTWLRPQMQTSMNTLYLPQSPLSIISFALFTTPNPFSPLPPLCAAHRSFHLRLLGLLNFASYPIHSEFYSTYTDPQSSLHGTFLREWRTRYS